MSPVFFAAKTFPVGRLSGLLMSVILAMALISVGGCAKPRLEKAFAGELDQKTADEVISEYCSTCHTHRNFNSISHVERIESDYGTYPGMPGREDASPGACRRCHNVETDFLGETARSTVFPGK